jgi:ubiquinone/menaquinone biosynthesis C-methylase UbiE
MMAHGGERRHERRFHGSPEMLRSPGRVALMEVERVVALCLEGLDAKSALDVGTGSGVFAEGFAAQGLEVAGIDANPAMIEAARRTVPQGSFELAPAEAIPYGDAAFDLVFLGFVLHEADDPLAALKEARRVARARVAVLEWPYRLEAHVPPLAFRLQTERVVALAGEAGFQKVETMALAHTTFFRLGV